MDSRAVLSIENLEFRYPNTGFRLCVPTLSLEAGEKLAVIGPSGSGKTTFLNLAAGILTPEAGSIRVAQGEKQRTAICRALLPGPKLILTDEATGNLAPENNSRILDLLFEAVDAHEASLLAVTHDHELLPRFHRTVDCRQFVPGLEAVRAAADAR